VVLQQKVDEEFGVCLACSVAIVCAVQTWVSRNRASGYFDLNDLVLKLLS
jgi:hypothetical protein